MAGTVTVGGTADIGAGTNGGGYYGHRYYHSGYYRWHGGWRYFAGGYNPWWLLPIPVPYPYYGDMVPATVMDMDRVTATGIKKI